MSESREYYSRSEPYGDVYISEEVLEMIAGAAALEVEGVTGLAGGTMSEQLLGRKKLSKGITIVQYWGKEIHTSEVADRIKKIWTDDMGKKATDLKDLKIYIKPEDNGAHYVINGDVTGFIGL